MGPAPLERHAVKPKRTFNIIRRAAFWLPSAFIFCLLRAVADQASVTALPASTNNATVLVVVGAPGEPDFATNFIKQANLWDKACQQAGARRVTIGLDENPGTNDLETLRLALDAEPKDGLAELWLVLIGHGTFDGKEAKFNLRGPDLSTTNLSVWLKPFQRPVVLIDTTSASAPFLTKLSATNRVIVSATRSGYEQNFTRFGLYFAEAIGSPDADLDRDGQTSLLEAFLSAAHRAAEYYKTAGRLATEHPLIDDNGDGLGTPADWFRGTRAVKKSADAGKVDGPRAHQFHLIRSGEEQKMTVAARARRDELELSIAQLRDAKEGMPENEYYRKLESLLLDLARIYEPPAP
jgi:hypothetical protein